jgi:hypothetical protein
MHHVDDVVRNTANGWLAQVVSVECHCGEQVDGPICPRGHQVAGFPLSSGADFRYTLTVRTPMGHIIPWCLPERFPKVTKTLWEHVAKDCLLNE